MSEQMQMDLLTSRVHTYVSSEFGILANAYLIETGDGIVAVDATLTVADATNFRNLLDSLHRQLQAVLITHGHPDHYNGLTQLIDGKSVPIIATEGVDRVIRKWDAEKEKQWKPIFGDQWPTERTFPNRIARDKESFVLGDVRFTVHDLGPGESHHDAYWIAEDGRDKIAFIGDLAFNGEHSYVSDGHTSRWLENLHKVRAGITRIYPGHGPAGGVELFERQRLYLERYRQEVQKLRIGRSGLTDTEKARLTQLMTEYLPGGKIDFLIAVGADAVANELENLEVRKEALLNANGPANSKM